METNDKRIDKARAVLELIYLTDWGWEGGGSDIRHSGESGGMAKDVLGFGDLPFGWPSEQERNRRIELRNMIKADAVTPIGDAELDAAIERHEARMMERPSKHPQQSQDWKKVVAAAKSHPSKSPVWSISAEELASELIKDDDLIPVDEAVMVSSRELIGTISAVRESIWNQKTLEYNVVYKKYVELFSERAHLSSELAKAQSTIFELTTTAHRTTQRSSQGDAERVRLWVKEQSEMAQERIKDIPKSKLDAMNAFIERISSTTPPPSPPKEADINKCPSCGGIADNGFDRCLPPNPYCCTKCDSKEAAQVEGQDGN